MSLTHHNSKRDINPLRIFQHIGVLCLAAVGLAALTLPAQATAPTYSVTISGGGLNPNPICDGLSATGSFSGNLQISNPNNEYAMSAQSWSWSASVTGYKPNATSGSFGSLGGASAPAVSISGGGSTGTLTATASASTSPGDYQITVTGQDSFTVTDNTQTPPVNTGYSPSNSTTTTIVNVTIGGLQYNDPTNGWTALPSELDALVGTSVPLKALPTPSDSSFPSSMPIWSGLASGSGTTATASYSGQSVTVGDQSIKVHLGTVSNGRTSTATAYKLVTSFAPTVTFTGRSDTDLGIGEVGLMNFTPSPVGTPMPNTYWSLSGSGTILDNGSGTNSSGDFYAGTTAGSANFKLNISSGPSAGKNSTLGGITIHVPESAQEVTDTSLYDYHVAGDASAGFAGIITLLPSNCSLTAVQFGETNCAPSTATGDFAGDISGHMPGKAIGYVNWDSVGIVGPYVNVTTTGGQQVEDQVLVDVSPLSTTPHWDGGQCVFTIPWSYSIQVRNGTTTTTAAIGGVSPVAQTASTTTSGGATITKLSGSDTTTQSSPAHSLEPK